MRLRANKETVLPPIPPNEGVRSWYYRQMASRIHDMHWDIVRTVAVGAKADDGVMMDANPFSAIMDMFSKAAAYWQKKFDREAEEVAKGFVGRAAKAQGVSMKSRMKKAGFAVDFGTPASYDGVVAMSVADNVALIKSIPEQYLLQVRGMVSRSVLAGRDVASLTQELHDQYGVTIRRASFIALDQNNKVHESIDRVRALELGLDEAIWMHSNAGKEPREDHVEAGKSRLRFKIAEGAPISGEMIHPGQKPWCRCLRRLIIPGMND